MVENLVLVEKSAGIATVTLNRPEKLNAISGALRTAIAQAFEELQKDPEVSVAIFTGAGRAFSAGVDLKELGTDTSRLQQPRTPSSDPVKAMGAFGGPIIGAINGVAITGGFELAVACDILIASTEAKFADTHGRVGIMPGWGLSQKLSRMIGIGRAKELSLTGNYLSAEQAEQWGLVNRVVAPAELMSTCRQLAEDMLTLAPGMLAGYKQLIDDGYDRNFADAMALEAEVSHSSNTTVRAADVEARREGIRQRGQSQSGAN